MPRRVRERAQSATSSALVIVDERTTRDDDGVPDEAAFVFSNALDARYSFREWRGQSLVPFELPRAGPTVTFRGRVPDLF